MAAVGNRSMRSDLGVLVGGACPGCIGRAFQGQDVQAQSCPRVLWLPDGTEVSATLSFQHRSYGSR